MTPKGLKYKKEYSLELLKIARGDLGSAKDLLGGSLGRPENIFYLSQQAIEKAIKAVLCSSGIALIHTHDMEALVNQLPQDQLPPDSTQLFSLTEFATVRRYEEGFVILGPDDLKNIVNLAERIIDWATAKIAAAGVRPNNP